MLSSQTLTPLSDYCILLPFAGCRYGFRTGVPSSGSRIVSLTKCCRWARCQDEGLSSAACACLPPPWAGSTSALIHCRISPDSPLCCPLEDTQPSRAPALLHHHTPPDSLTSGTVICAASDQPPLQCSPWPLCPHWKPLVTGTRASAGLPPFYTVEGIKLFSDKKDRHFLSLLQLQSHRTDSPNYCCIYTRQK